MICILINRLDKLSIVLLLFFIIYIEKCCLIYLLPKESQMNDFSDNDGYNFGRKKHIYLEGVSYTSTCVINTNNYSTNEYIKYKKITLEKKITQLRLRPCWFLTDVLAYKLYI